jgi:hypothetical protein
MYKDTTHMDRRPINHSYRALCTIFLFLATFQTLPRQEYDFQVMGLFALLNSSPANGSILSHEKASKIGLIAPY